MTRLIQTRAILVLTILVLCHCVALERDEYRAATEEERATMQIAHLGLDSGDAAFAALRETFEARNPGYALEWTRALSERGASPQARIVFVQEGEGQGSVIRNVNEAGLSEVTVGDIVLLRPGETLLVEPAIAALTFTIPHDLPEELPSFIRPDWDPRITDTPGGCATETGAYRRILLTWLRDKGPYTLHSLNAHRVRITDSFTHYHPVDGGFDEFYLVQMVQPGGRILTSSRVDLIEKRGLTRDEIDDLLVETELAVGDLVYLPRGVVHRGVGGVLAQVITIPGFRPGAEIGVDHHLRRLNESLGLEGEAALPFNEEASDRPVVR